MRTAETVILRLLSSSLAVSSASAGGADRSSAPSSSSGGGGYARTVLLRGGPLVGAANGLMFDRDNNLLVAQVFGRTISKLDPETGDVLDQLGFEDGVLFPDDLAVGSDGTVYWTDNVLGTVLYLPPGDGQAAPLLPYGSVPFANPLTISDDEPNRLFVAQCTPSGPDSVYEVDLSKPGSNATEILGGVTGCASNGMDYRDGALYMPRPTEGRVVRLDVSGDGAAGAGAAVVTDVTTGLVSPNAVKFDWKGALHVSDYGAGRIVRVDLTNPDAESNREVVAEVPVWSNDNLAFDEDDRLYVSSNTDGSVREVLLPGGEFRTVSGGVMSVPMGISVVGGTVYTVHPGALFGIDADAGGLRGVVRSDMFLGGTLPQPTSVASRGDGHLVLMSFTAGRLAVYDPSTESVVTSARFGNPVDCHPFRGDLLITDSATGDAGDVVLASGTDLDDRTVVATTEGAAFLAGNDDDVYASDGGSGHILKIASGGEILDQAVVIATGLVSPEGVALHPDGTTLYVVDGGNGTLLELDLSTGEMGVLADGLGFLPGIPGLPFGFPNDVAVDDGGAVYINVDGTNEIYKFEPIGGGNGTEDDLSRDNETDKGGDGGSSKANDTEKSDGPSGADGTEKSDRDGPPPEGADDAAEADGSSAGPGRMSYIGTAILAAASAALLLLGTAPS